MAEDKQQTPHHHLNKSLRDEDGFQWWLEEDPKDWGRSLSSFFK